MRLLRRGRRKPPPQKKKYSVLGPHAFGEGTTKFLDVHFEIWHTSEHVAKFGCLMSRHVSAFQILDDYFHI